MPALRDRVLPLAARGLLELPAPVHRALAGRPPAPAAGLAPDAWLLAQLAERGSVPPGALPVDEARKRFAKALGPLGIRPRLPLTATDRTVAGAAGPLPARLYVPHGAQTPGPLLLYFHRRGWVDGSGAAHPPSWRLRRGLAGHAGAGVPAARPPRRRTRPVGRLPARARAPVPRRGRRRARRLPRRAGARGRAPRRARRARPRAG